MNPGDAAITLCPRGSNLEVHIPVGECLGCFQCRSVKDKAAKYIPVRSFCESAFHLFGKWLGVTLLGHEVVVCLIFKIIQFFKVVMPFYSATY